VTKQIKMEEKKKVLTLLILLSGVQGSILPSKDSSCDTVYCRAGRECMSLDSNSDFECVCITKCPSHWKPVCGSDGVSYDNHCELHRKACIDGKPISPIHPGFCKKSREDLLAREEFIEEISKLGVKKKAPIPMACFENDRNRLLEFLVSWFNLSASKQDWYSHGMSSDEILSGHFTAMDVSKDGYLDTTEMYKYISSKGAPTEPQTKADKIRELCLDAMIEEGDVNMDWRLGFQEYKEILKPDYEPSVQVCKMNNKMYNDGAETTLECNGCVCACGKWVCTSNKCSQGYSDVFTNHLQEDLDDDLDSEDNLRDAEDDYEDSDEDNDDDVYDDDNNDDADPEDDPDVQDINWF